jgi:Family of unknown function (DUF6510)
MDSALYEDSLSLMLDGNALAGMLHELFDVEMTIAPVVCDNCGQVGELGSLWVFAESPGYVLRCPTCQNIVLRMSITPREVFLDARGASYLSIPRRK